MDDKNVWIVHGKNYDLSSFVDSHPGGKDMILLGKGRDCTEIFESIHIFSKNKPHSILQKYQIVDDKEPSAEIFKWESNGFYKTVASRVDDYFTKNKLSYKGSWKYHLKCLTMFIVGFYFLYSALYAGPYSFLFAALAGIVMEQFHFCSMHDGSHSAVSKRPIINILYTNITYWFFLDTWIWLRHHVYGHHSYTGIYNKDPDLVNTKPWVRKHEIAAWRPVYKWQHLHTWFLLMVFPNQHWGQVFQYLISSTTKKIFGVPLEIQPFSLFKSMVFMISFCFHFVAPLMFITFCNMIIVNFIYWTVIGISYFVLVLPNHDNDLVIQTMITPSIQNPVDWGEMQVRHTSNHSIGSTIFACLYGGMNYQIEHHLFPGVNHEHYADIAPIVLKTCHEFNIPYNAKDSLFDAFIGYFKMLKHHGKKTS